MTNLILPPDTVLQDRYRIVRLVAQGGMGAVYQANDTRLGSTVALKQILVSDTRLRKAFEREARLLASLRHPALPVVSDHFTEERGQFVVMQFIPGDDLGTQLERKNQSLTESISMAQIMDWADRLLDALDYLHSHKPPIIHRDIKPQNLKLTPRGEIVLLDFGLAKGSVTGNTITSTTARSVRAYTTQYAPLEQIQGTGTEPRSDLYALAATLYHLLTNVPPASALTRAAAVLEGKPDPLVAVHKLNPKVPPPLSAILHQAMAHAIARRFSSAAAMRSALSMVKQSVVSEAATAGSVGQQTIVMPAAPMMAERLQGEPLVSPVSAETNASSVQSQSGVQTLIVSPNGDGHFTTIKAALASAQPHSRIRVRPGVYREELVLEKPLEIIGEGAASDIVVETHDARALVVRTEQATVRGMTFRLHASNKTTMRPTVDITQGRLSLEHCIIISQHQLCVSIHGSSANPALWRCQIYGSKGIGVLVYDEGRGTIEECTIYDHAHVGVAVRHTGNPTIRRCKIYNNAQDGIFLDEKGQGTIEECEVWGNVRAGIEIKRGSSPIIRRCTVRDQRKGYGIYICDRGEGIIESCVITGNARAGIAVAQNSSPLIRHCKILRDQQRGLFFYDHSRGTVEECEIIKNGQVGVEIRQGSHPTLRDCTISQHQMVGVLSHQGGSGTVEGCDLRNNQHGPWYIEEGSTLTRKDNVEETPQA